MSAASRDPAGRSADFVQLLREFLSGYAAFAELFARHGPHEIPFARIRELVGDDEGAVLFRMKEKSHALFRTDEYGSEVVRHEALFDLALGSLFHEAMKLRESLYQREVYGPRVAQLRDAADEQSEALIVEFDRILGKSVARLDEVVAEVRVLLAQTRDQLRRLLLERAGDRRVTRCLLSRKEQVDAAFGEGLDGLLKAMHGNTATGLVEGARALLESAYYVEALATLRRARGEAEAPLQEIHQLELYAEGMQAVLDGRYATSIETLTAWVEADGHLLEREFARLASAVLGRLGPLLRDDADSAAWTARARALQQRMEGGGPPRLGDGPERG
ncbi:MAG: hypothetical protein U0900_18905 [Myxococcota bacterium]